MSTYTISALCSIGVLLTLALLLSLAFRFSTTAAVSSPVTQQTRQRLVAFHAFALESAQLLLLALGICHLWTAIANSPHLYTRLLTLPEHMVVTTWASGYLAAIYAVDFIETLVVLETISHPVQAQTFVLTRKMACAAVSRLCKRLGRKVHGLQVPEDGSIVVVAKRGFGVQRVQRVVLVRRISTGATASRKEHTMLTMQGSEMARMWSRRHSFPDDQLHTGPLLHRRHSVSKLREAEDGQPESRSTYETPATPAKARSSSISCVRTMVNDIDGKSGVSRKEETSDSLVGVALGQPRVQPSSPCERAAKAHVAPRWRPAGGRVE